MSNLLSTIKNVSENETIEVKDFNLDSSLTTKYC